ncbi:MAG: TonB-dependent receptor [Pseudomonadota bacterium]
MNQLGAAALLSVLTAIPLASAQEAPATEVAEAEETQTTTITQSIEIAAPNVVEEIVVLGRFIPDEKRTTSEISNVLDQEALGLLADSSVGDALARVTGLSLVGGKYVYVRGLGERYSSTLLDGSRISSPVPFQKTVPLDIVPKAIVRNLLVQKTFSAQYPGDFSGGVVDIRTRATPEENYLSLSLGAGGNSETTGGDGLDYRGGDTDNWGYDDGTRHQPENVRVLSSENFEDVEFPQDRALGASFFNLWDVYERNMKPDFSGDAEAGLRFDMDNGFSIGAIVAGRYKNQYRNIFKDFRRYEFTGVDGGSRQTVDYDQNTTTQTINLSGFANIGLEFGDDHTISFTHVILRQTDNQLQQLVGLSSEDDVTSGTPVESYRLQWVENEIRSTSLKGEHFFNLSDAIVGAGLSWRYVDGSGLRESPDRRTYTYAENNDGLQEVVVPSDQAAGDLREVFQAPERNFAKLNDDIEEYGFDLDVPITVGDAEVTLKAGFSEYERTRESRDRLFRFDITNEAPDFLPLQTPGQLFGLDNWGAGYLDVRDFSASAANASGIFPFAESGEETTSYYAAIDAQVTPRIRLQAGIRQEDATLFADAFGGNTEQGTINDVEQNYDDTLPSASATFEFVNDMQVRVAWSQTVNRPSLLEITGTTIRNPENFQLYRGNVFLEPADVENLDLRWEWYYGDADSVSVGLFMKDLDNPIELGLIQAQNDIFTWFNAEEAELEGVEFEFRKDLYLGSWFGWGSAWDLFTLNANVSFIDSEVTLLGEGETAADVPLTGGRQIARLFQNERQLSGQSDVLGNLQLSYVNFDAGIEASLAYNYTGDRIVLVGSDNAPDIIEDERGKLDLLFKYRMPMWRSEVEVEFKIQNLLDEPVIWTQGGQIYEKYDIGVAYSLGLKIDI